VFRERVVWRSDDPLDSRSLEFPARSWT